MYTATLRSPAHSIVARPLIRREGGQVGEGGGASGKGGGASGREGGQVGKKELCNNFRRGGMCRIQRSDISCKLANFRRGGMCRVKDQTYHASLLISEEVVCAGFKY